MASISLPLPPHAPTAFPQHIDSPGQSYSRHSRRNLTMSTPLPNPPFVFPAREPDDTSAQPSVVPETHHRAPLPLPAFSFNPGSTSTTQPPVPAIPPNRAGGHRRRCSELIGGDKLVTSGAAEGVQTSDESPLPAPANLPTPGPGFSAGGHGRRHHAHRRSAAISGVDLAAITKALESKPVGSAPPTPADSKRENGVHELARPVSYSATALNRPTPPASPRISITGSSPLRAKSESPDRLSATGLPYSPVIRQGSSGSIPISEPQITTRNIEKTGTAGFLYNNEQASTANGSITPRPKTADALLMFDLNATAVNHDISSLKRPTSAAGHTRFHKSLSSGILDATTGRKNRVSDDYHLTDSSRRSSSDDLNSSSSDDEHPGSDEAHASKKSRLKAKKRQKKVRSWAGAILTRGKGKRHQSKKETLEADSAVVPPVITRTNSDLGSGLDVDFDDDTIVVIRTPTNPNAPDSGRFPSEVEAQPSFENSWKPRSFYEQGSQDDALSPVIDLDAALGPFNTPDMRAGKGAGNGFSAVSRRMYSGGRRGEFVGPEMRYHRRAESAPEMPPFDRSFLNNRLANSSSLEVPDVFYEEEEDAFLAATTESPQDGRETVSDMLLNSSNDNSDQQTVGSRDTDDTMIRPTANVEPKSQQAGLGISSNELCEGTIANTSFDRQEMQNKPEMVAQEIAVDHLRNANNPFGSPGNPVESLQQESWPNKAPIPLSPEISPRFLPADSRPATSPLELTGNIPQFSLQSTCFLSNSSFPSPDFTLSSSDAPRSITTSSTTDRNFSNPSYNPSVDLPHASMEDVPSLTSSASTTTNTLGRFSGTFFHRSRPSTDRSASFSAAVHRRSSHARSQKRSSLASLSKLVGGPNGERSKLSIEEKPPSDAPEKTKKKGRRLSRLMHFWRTNEKEKLTEDVVREEQRS
ncbi:putative cell wall proline rich protein [Aspergillus clavatus NRRL 1]|uniref:Cell wall proline rich protein, putative n=1 Tax=Aspergillus clavatus (strain ATCC 1007 / CBS 513.65 / DSM 816 / NCTC 3887 / NRRL 1 / QM 1276 / 107) TaxID=344612 RepID=A1CPB3_ASPCL|nr:cell wall proline rich protein, putative [Aspergillus clavatus NRRL 1]EAW07484.1 cell wall proline rich protein, putative [Aspergillus clavatus NRRL 1]